MSNTLPFSENTLQEWAGWRVFRDGKALFERGVVEKVAFEHPFVTGMLNLGPRGMRCRFEVLENGLVENHCPCRANREKGLICSHLTALGLEALHYYKVREAKTSGGKNRVERIARAVEGVRLRRIREDTPGAVKARLIVELCAAWREQIAIGLLRLYISIEIEGKKIITASNIPTDVFYAFSSQNERLLYALEDIRGKGIQSEIEISIDDLIHLLCLHHGTSIREQGRGKKYPVGRDTLHTVVEMDMDRTSGEMMLELRAKRSCGETEASPIYIIGQKTGWVFSSDQFRPLNDLLPKSIWNLYRSPVVIPRQAVPAFLMNELPRLEKHSEVRSSITPDLFHMKPAHPDFCLMVKGSPASLSATLYARYKNEVELVAGRADMRGNFAFPDERDLLRYRIRNMEAEKEAVKKLASIGFTGGAGDTPKSIIGPREVLNFLGSGVPRIRRFGWQVELEGRIKPLTEKTGYVLPVVRVEKSDEKGWFDVSYEYESSSGNISEQEIQLALLKGDSFIKRNSRTILLDADAIKQAQELFADCAAKFDQKTGRFRINNIHGGYIEASLRTLDRVALKTSPPWLEYARQQNDHQSMQQVKPSLELKAALRSYQQEGLNWLRFLEIRGFCGILADEMGLGKTLQTLAWLQLERSDKSQQGKAALIVCPTSLVENWREEAARFTPNLKVLVLQGTGRHRKWKNVEQSDMVITSYALIRRDIEKHLEYVYSIAILDEAQHIKNSSTQNALAAKQIKARHRLVLTGTPIENGVADLWSIMDYLMPGYLGGHKHFREEYERPILNEGEEGEQAKEKLRRKLHPFLLRRLKKQVAKELPPKIERIAPCRLTQDQHRVYQQLLMDSRNRVKEMVEQEGFNKCRVEILRILLRLRQACNHIDLLKLEGVKSQNPSAKMELFFELLNEALDSGHRVLVFSQFTSMLAILMKEMDERELTYCYLDGNTKNRQEVVRNFNKSHFIPVFLMSLKAGGIGLNLTGADMVIHFDPWWNPAVENQATDRAHRIGQKRTVYSVKLITRGTIEEKVVEMQERKKGIIDAALSMDMQIMQKLAFGDVQELLNL